MGRKGEETRTRKEKGRSHLETKEGGKKAMVGTTGERNPSRSIQRSGLREWNEGGVSRSRIGRSRVSETGTPGGRKEKKGGKIKEKGGKPRKKRERGGRKKVETHRSSCR
jgi:hypothetical protein